jgi:glycosyltransferase involved in cell wall biosynthesis
MIGERSAALASEAECGLLSYSYYAPFAIDRLAAGLPLGIFQVHPAADQVAQTMTHLRGRGLNLPLEPEELYPAERRASMQRSFDRAGAVLCTSGFVARGLRSLGVDERRIHIVPYGLTSEAIERPTSAGSGGSRLVMGWLGQPIERKGFGILAQALQQIRRQDIEIRVLGRNGTAAKKGLPRTVQVSDSGPFSASHRYEVLADIDVLVAPSLVEGYGLAIHEALAVGVPVLGSDHTMLADIPVASRSLPVIAAGDVPALAKAIDELDIGHLRSPSIRTATRAAVVDRTWAAFRSGVVAAVNTA